MPPRPSDGALARFLTFVWLLALVSVPTVQLVRSWGEPTKRPWEMLAAALPDLDRLASSGDGLMAASQAIADGLDDFERRLESESVMLDTFLPLVQRGLSALGGAGNQQVYLGRDGWLFYRPGIDYLVGPPFPVDAASPGPLASLVDFHRQLRARRRPGAWCPPPPRRRCTPTP